MLPNFDDYAITLRIPYSAASLLTGECELGSIDNRPFTLSL